jgi:hypothetical protein
MPFPRTPSQRIRKTDLMVGGQHDVAAAWDQLQPSQTDATRTAD